MACRNGQRPVVALLLREGADVGLTNSYGLTPLMRAAREGHPEVRGEAGLITDGAEDGRGGSVT
jgi:ankyrin repeat protein